MNSSYVTQPRANILMHWFSFVWMCLLIKKNLPCHEKISKEIQRICCNKPLKAQSLSYITDGVAHSALKSSGLLDDKGCLRATGWSENLDAILLYHIKYQNLLTWLPDCVTKRKWKGAEERAERTGKDQHKNWRVEKREKNLSGREKVGCYVLVFFNTVMFVENWPFVHVCVEPYPM